MSPRPYPYKPHPMRLRQRSPNPKHAHPFKNTLGIARIASVEDARGYLCLARCEEDTAAAIDVVEVIGQGGKPFAFKIVRCLLEYYMTNITALKLRLSFEPTPCMLRSFEFKNLKIFETNIPHILIAPFLARHTDITHLVLDVCNVHTATTAVACPLIDCHLPHIEELSCPKGCVRPLLSVAALPAGSQGSPLRNLQVIHNIAQDATFPLQDLFDFRRIPTSSQLNHIHLDFDHTAPTLLQALSMAAPLLKTLRLVESKFSDRDKKPLWDDAYTWQGGFLSFTHLTRLLIRTSRSITPDETPSSECEDEEHKLARQRRQEDAVIREWLVFPPPSLTEVRIWTKAFAGRTNGERMSTWVTSSSRYWDCDRWEVAENRPIEGEEVCGGDFI